MSDYKESIADILIEKLKENLPNGYFKEFFYGDPLAIPVNSLPCVIVRKEGTQITQGATGLDVLTHTVVVQLAYNKKNDWGKSASEVVGTRKLEEYAEGRDSTTGQYDAKSVVGILRKNFTLGNIATDQDIVIEYGIVGRPDDQITAECQITCTIEEHVPVPIRT